MYKVIKLKYEMKHDKCWNNFCDELYAKVDEKLLTIEQINEELKRFDARYTNNSDCSVIFETEQGYMLYLLIYN